MESVRMLVYTRNAEFYLLEGNSRSVSHQLFCVVSFCVLAGWITLFLAQEENTAEW